jgi:hypothetical protein
MILEKLDNMGNIYFVCSECNKSSWAVEEIEHTLECDDNAVFEPLTEEGVCGSCERFGYINFEGLCIDCNLKGV